uniref:Secreted protein n=1 Tax=Picea glauca TaxID=3330 RepID=A0A101M212_PICGL|nr:hypothetical protein ABT39_MTgene2834 [Picea glauca]QHR87634.1 hypothetical protein Q903MT_gene1646 [Picea sitchensis]
MQSDLIFMLTCCSSQLIALYMCIPENPWRWQGQKKRKPTRWQAYRDGNGGLDWTTLTRYYLVMHLEKLIMHGCIIT